MVTKLKIRKVNLTFAFRHRWDNNDEFNFNSEFKDYRLGFWFKKSKIVGVKMFNNPKEWSNNLVNDYTFGVDLVVCKMWVSYNWGGKSISFV